MKAERFQTATWQQHDQILDGFVVLVSLCFDAQGFDDGMVGVDFQVLLGGHVTHGGGIPQSLSLHDTLHVGCPAALGGDDNLGDSTKRLEITTISTFFSVSCGKNKIISIWNMEKWHETEIPDDGEHVD
jgi:hypothetical protein